MIPLLAVLTTIQEPTSSVGTLSRALDEIDARVVVIGDKKGPLRFALSNADFYPLERQLGLPYRLATLLPQGHYSRKNLGYLIAFNQGPRCIYETDDDNAPLPCWAPRSEQVEVRKLAPCGSWLNVYKIFKDEHIWPRGFPLGRVNDLGTQGREISGQPETVTAPIQQGLANGAPDVDAVWRLLMDHQVEFNPGVSVWLPPRTYCPFNSQSTWWWPDAYPLMYLPSFCSFRMTDIWRSFIAQRCLWEISSGMVFHAAEVYQARNTHDLLRDFKDEVPGYLHNEEIVDILDQCSLLSGRSNIGENLRRCYQMLIDANLIPAVEMPLVEAWLSDFNLARQYA